MSFKTLLKTSAVFAAPWTVGALGSGGGLYALLHKDENQDKQEVDEELTKLLEAEELKAKLEREKNELEAEINGLNDGSEEKQTNISNWDDSTKFLGNSQITEEISKISARNSSQIDPTIENTEATQLKKQVNDYLQGFEGHKNTTKKYLNDLLNKHQIKNIELTNQNKSGIEEEILKRISELKGQEEKILLAIKKMKELDTAFVSQIADNQRKKSSGEERKQKLATQIQNVGTDSMLSDTEETIEDTGYQTENIGELETTITQSKKAINEGIDDIYLLYSGILKTTQYKNFSIKPEKATLKTKGSPTSTFSSTSESGKSTEFKVKKDNKLFEIEEFVNKTKNNGFKFLPYARWLEKWDQQFTLKLLNNYGETETTISEETISIKEIFHSETEPIENLLRAVVRVLITIEIIKSKHLEKNDKDVFEMKKSANIPKDNNFQFKRGNSFADTKWTVEINGFSSKNEFIKYWITKTLELLTTGKVDFTDILDPFYQKGSYST